MENIINKAIKLADGILYLEKNKPKSKPSPNLTPKAAKRKRSDSDSPTSVPTPTSTKSLASASQAPGCKRPSTAPSENQSRALLNAPRRSSEEQTAPDQPPGAFPPTRQLGALALVPNPAGSPSPTPHPSGTPEGPRRRRGLHLLFHRGARGNPGVGGAGAHIFLGLSRRAHLRTPGGSQSLWPWALPLPHKRGQPTGPRSGHGRNCLQGSQPPSPAREGLGAPA